jgi:hypothetical protein
VYLAVSRGLIQAADLVSHPQLPSKDHEYSCHAEESGAALSMTKNSLVIALR